MVSNFHQYTNKKITKEKHLNIFNLNYKYFFFFVFFSLHVYTIQSINKIFLKLLYTVYISYSSKVYFLNRKTNNIQVITVIYENIL